MAASTSAIKKKVEDGSLQAQFKSLAESIRKNNKFDPSVLPIEYADLFSFYLYLSRSASVSETFNRIVEYLEWRERLVEMSSPVSLDHILGCNVMNIYRCMPECHFGYDRTHRPVMYFLFGRQDITEALTIINRKRIFDYHLWQNDAINELCYHKAVEAGSMISSGILVIDVAGLTTETVSSEFLHILSRRAEVNGRYFPYLFDKIIILNAVSSESKIISTLKDFCKSFSPRANVYITGPEREASEVLSVYIDMDQIPSEYGGLKGSLFSITHPFYDAMTFRRAGGGVLVHRQGGVSYVHGSSMPTAGQSPSKEVRKVSVASTSFGAGGVYDADDEFNNLSVSMGASLIDALEDSTGRTYSTCSSRAPAFGRAKRSASITSSLSAFGGGAKSDFVLSGIAMTPAARVALGAFVELMLGGSPAACVFTSDLCMAGMGDGTTTIASMSPISSISLDGASTLSIQRTAPRPPVDAWASIQVSLPLKPSIFSILIDGVLQTSVGSSAGSDADVLSIKTSTGVVLMKALAVGPPVDPKAQLSAYTPKKIAYKKYSGNLVLSAGRVYSLTRGASMSGWLQKWPMRSQSAGGYTHRYFILEDNELKYWKFIPKGVAQQSGSRGSAASTTIPHISDPPKSCMLLTPNTVLKRAKTLFGSSIIEIKSEFDTLTVCAYSAAEDTAWYSELYHALERVKKIYRDECSNERPFPEVVWRQQDPSCVAVSCDVVDLTSSEVSYRNYETSRQQTGGDPGVSVDSTQVQALQYAVLCRVHTGLSSLHSVQIGPVEHTSIRLENTDLDLGVKLLIVKLCGDCLILSGTNGFIGSGKIPHLSEMASGSQLESRRVYVRRMPNSFHSDDAVVNVLATPNPVALSDTDEDIANTVLSSGDDLGCLCVWRRDRPSPGTAQSPASSSVARNGYSWSCVHHAKVGHKITSMSFSPNGQTLAVCTVERAILFDISPIVTSTDNHVLSLTTDINSAPKCQIRTVVIDDIVGMNTTDSVFAVDLSRIGVLKVWKITEGFDLNGGGAESSNGLVDSRHGSGTDRNTGNIADKVSYLEMGLDQVLKSSDSCVSLADLFSLSRSSALSVSPPSSPTTTRPVPTHEMDSGEESDRDDKSVNSEQNDGNSPKDAVSTVADAMITSRDTAESGFCVDPFGYADVFVIDPLRMHLRDWWCDYSSRYLLLGHGRVSALTNFEAPGMITKMSDKQEGAPSTSGLNKRSSNMFWSTLTSSLGRRVICRYYIPLAYHEKRKKGLDVKLDCIHFVLVLARCLYETLGDEYHFALLCAWKANALDHVRNTLEKLASSWFRDVTIVFQEVLRRIELSPSLTLNSLDELIAAVGVESHHSPTSGHVVDIDAVMELFTSLRQSLSLIADEYGIMHIVKSDRSEYVKRGIRPIFDSSSKNKSDNLLLGISTDGWEADDACQLARIFVVEPLLHLERTEPFAVALAIVGLQRVPSFIYDSVMNYDESMRAAAEQQAAPSEDRTSAEKLAASLKSKKTPDAIAAKEEAQEKCIEGLVSIMAKEMPPWIRFILTSDTSDCDHSG